MTNKLNGTLWKIIALVMGLLLAAGAAVYGYGELNGRFEAVEKEILKVNENEDAIVGLQKDIEYIRESVDRIEKKL